ASYVRPDSERGNAPPMNSLYVFLMGRRVTRRTAGTARARAHPPPGPNPTRGRRPTAPPGASGCARSPPPPPRPTPPPPARTPAPFAVHTPALSPYIVLFAFSTASAGVRNVRTERTGPKISSCAIR